MTNTKRVQNLNANRFSPKPWNQIWASRQLKWSDPFSKLVTKSRRILRRYHSFAFSVIYETFPIVTKMSQMCLRAWPTCSRRIFNDCKWPEVAQTLRQVRSLSFDFGWIGRTNELNTSELELPCSRGFECDNKCVDATQADRNLVVANQRRRKIVAIEMNTNNRVPS